MLTAASVTGRITHVLRSQAVRCSHCCTLVGGHRGFSHLRAETGLNSTASTSGSTSVAPPDIRKLAQLAHIAVTDQEIEDWEPKIAGIVDWFGQLQAADVAGVKPAVHSREEGNVLRADAARPCDDRQALLAALPDREQSFAKVPKSSSSSGSAAAAKVVPSAAAVDFAALQALDIRVGRIVNCSRHPDADSLYVEKIDVGEAEPRTIVSGLVKFVPIEQMQDRNVVVLCNLKPRNMRGIKSFGMVLAASDAAHENVEPLTPPAGAAPGERVWFGDNTEQAAPAEANQVQKKKFWETVQPALKTDDACTAMYQDLPMNTSSGPITSASLKAARIA